MNYNRNLSVFAKGQQNSTDFWNDFGYWNDGTYWFEATPTYTARVTAFANATGITDYIILNALNNFNIGLITYGLDTDMTALYPMVTDKYTQSEIANQMKYNFMNPLNTDAAFRLVWNGGWTYSANGALPNGTNAYANTSLNPTNSFSTNDNSHLSFYSRTSTAGNNSNEIGCTTSGTSFFVITLYRSDSSNNTYYGINTVSTFPSFVDNSSAGFYIGNRIGNTQTGFKNNLKKSTTSSSPTTRPNLNVVLSSSNISGVISQYSKDECAFASIGNGLTDQKSEIFSTLVNNLQKELNRAVY